MEADLKNELWHETCVLVADVRVPSVSVNAWIMWVGCGSVWVCKWWGGDCFTSYRFLQVIGSPRKMTAKMATLISLLNSHTCAFSLSLHWLRNMLLSHIVSWLKHLLRRLRPSSDWCTKQKWMSCFFTWFSFLCGFTDALSITSTSSAVVSWHQLQMRQLLIFTER